MQYSLMIQELQQNKTNGKWERLGVEILLDENSDLKVFGVSIVPYTVIVKNQKLFTNIWATHLI